jgi:hypothetical protein
MRKKSLLQGVMKVRRLGLPEMQSFVPDQQDY